MTVYMPTPICKNPNCKKEITTKTKLGKFPQHCSVECRYATPRGGKQYKETPPICFLDGCNNSVKWHPDKRVWRKYCCFECGQKGKSIEISKTKLYKNSLKPIIEKRIQMKCSIDGCNTLTFLRRKKGTIYAYCSDECRNKGRVINQNKRNNLNFGVDRPSQNSAIFEKSQKNGKKLRDYIFSSGHIVQVRGYEPKALALLESKGYTENNLTVDSKEMPKIWYEQNGRHRYHPDIYIPSAKLILEVKSTFTYNRELEKNLLKRQACLDAGYNFKFMIFDKDGNLIE